MKKIVALITVICICLASLPCVLATESYVISADDWAEGENGVAFKDSDGVAVETNNHGGKTTVKLKEGEWVKYSLPELEQGIYKLSINAACASNATVNIDVGNTRNIGFAPISSTGGGDTYSKIELGNVFIYDGAEEITVSNDKYRVGYTNTSFNYESLTLERVSDDVKVRIYADKTIPGGQGVGSYSTRYAEGKSDRTPEKAADINYYTGIIQRSGDWAKYDISYLPEGTYNVSFVSAHPSNITLNMVTVLDDGAEYAKTMVIPKTANSGYTTFAESGVIDQIFVRDASETLLINGQASAYNLRYIELEFVDSENLTLVDEYKFDAQNIYSKEAGVGFYDNGEHAASLGKWEKNTSNGISSTVFRNGEWGKYDISLLKPGRYCAYFYGGAKDDCPIELTVDDNRGVEFTFEKTGSYTTYQERRSVFFDVPENSRHLKIKASKIAFIIDVTLKIINELEFIELDGNLGKTGELIHRGTDVLSLEFSNDMESAASCKVVSEDGKELESVFEINDGKIDILLKEALIADGEYNIIIENAEDVYGQNLSTLTASFMTTGEEDTLGEGVFTVKEGKYNYNDNTFTAVGNVLSSKGLPIKNRKVFLSIVDINGIKTKKAEFLTDENGEFEYTYKMPDGTESGKYEIVLSSDTVEKSQSYSILYFDDEGKEALVKEFEGKTKEEIEIAIETYGQSLNIDVERLESDVDDIDVVYDKLSEKTSYDDFEDLVKTVNCVIYTEYVNSADSNDEIEAIYNESLFRQYLGFDNNYLELLEAAEDKTLVQKIKDNAPYDNEKELFEKINSFVNEILVSRFELSPELEDMDNISITEGQIGTINIAFEEEEKNLSKIVLRVEASDDVEFFDEENVDINMENVFKNAESSFVDNVLTITAETKDGDAFKDICTIKITAPDGETGDYSISVDAKTSYAFDETNGYAVEPEAVDTKTLKMTVSKKHNSKTPGGSSSGGGSFSGGGSSDQNFASKPVDTQDKPQISENKGFSDIADCAWAHNAINYLAENGVISGKSEGIFAPNDKITRAEFCKIVVLAFEIPFTDVKGRFEDVSEGSWEHDYVMAAYSAGLINGIDETHFAPLDEIKREDMACIINRYLDLKTESAKLSFSDADDISDYAKEAVANLYSKKIINGMDNNMFAPKQLVTRAQAAQVVYNAVTEG